MQDSRGSSWCLSSAGMAVTASPGIGRRTQGPLALQQASHRSCGALQVFVRRGGPQWQAGLDLMRKCAVLLLCLLLQSGMRMSLCQTACESRWQARGGFQDEGGEALLCNWALEAAVPLRGGRT